MNFINRLTNEMAQEITKCCDIYRYSGNIFKWSFEIFFSNCSYIKTTNLH